MKCIQYMLVIKQLTGINVNHYATFLHATTRPDKLEVENIGCLFDELQSLVGVWEVIKARRFLQAYNLFPVSCKSFSYKFSALHPLHWAPSSSSHTTRSSQPAAVACMHVGFICRINWYPLFGLHMLDYLIELIPY